MLKQPSRTNLTWRVISVGLFVATGLLISGVLHGQTTTGRIVGTVSDPTSTVIAGVKVTARNMATGAIQTATTSAEGGYVIPMLPIGHYEVIAEYPGFKKHVRGPLQLLVEQTIRVDVEMEVGDQAERVDVPAAAPLIETDQSAVGKVMENKMIVELPLNGRDFVSLGALMPGTTTQGNGAGLTVNGARGEHNNFMLDGVDNNETIGGNVTIRPSIDAIQEFKVQTSNYSAEFGRASGAVVNIAIKSGTNNFHGTAYEFVRNDVFDARDFFTNYYGQDKTPLRRNQFGASFGGPIIRNRIFGFGNYEGFRERRSSTSSFVVPRAGMRQGDFTGLAQIYDPLQVTGNTRQAFAGNRIPDSRIHPISRKLLSRWPMPNHPSEPDRYVENMSAPDDRNQFHIRGDYHHSASQRFAIRVSRTISEAASPSIALEGGFTNTDNSGGMLSWTQVLSPNKLNEIRFGVTTYRFESLADGTGTDYAMELGLPSFALTDITKRHPTVSVRTIARIGGNPAGPLIRKQHSFQLIDQFSLVKGRHTVKAGFDAVRYRTNNFQPQHSAGEYQFNGPFTAQTGGTYANGFGDFLLGLPALQRILIPEFYDSGRLRNTRLSLYAQDDVTLCSNVTLNIGLRWERDGDWRDKFDRWGYFDFAAGQLVYPKTSNIPFALPYPHRFQDDDRLKVATNRAFAPRAGIAWRPFRHNRTVVRAAYGIFWGNPVGFILQNTALTVPPFLLRSEFTSSSTRPELTFGVFPGVSPEDFVPKRPAPYTHNPYLFTNPYVQQWNLGMEHEVMPNTAVKVGYVGSKGTHLERRFDGNPALPPGPGAIDPRRRYPAFAAIQYQDSGAGSTYHSLQASAERKMAGFWLLAGYTWSKALDDSSSWTGYGGQTSQFAQNPDRLDLEKGRSSFDVRHRMTLSFVHEIPLRPVHPFAKAVVGGWQTSGMITLRTGFPTDAVASNAIPNAGTSNTRPNVAGKVNLDPSERTIERWFNTAALVAPAPYTFGNAGRNIIDGPGSRGFDFALMKMFPVTEGHSLQFRGEFFNFLNHPNFGFPNRTVGSADFGKIRSGGGGREVQLALKYIF